jgi:hypothetical protein
MTTLHWTKAALAKRAQLTKSDKTLEDGLNMTTRSLREGTLKVPKTGNHTLPIFGTKYALELEIDTERMTRVKTISILDIKK